MKRSEKIIRDMLYTFFFTKVCVNNPLFGTKNWWKSFTVVESLMLMYYSVAAVCWLLLCYLFVVCCSSPNIVLLEQHIFHLLEPLRVLCFRSLNCTTRARLSVTARRHFNTTGLFSSRTKRASWCTSPRAVS